MIPNEQLLQVMPVPRSSEKSSLMETYNVFVFHVSKNSNKLNIKRSIEYLFSVNVHSVRTLNIKGKFKSCSKKNNKNNIGKRKDWKRAYVTLVSGQKINFFAKMDNRKGIKSIS